METVGKLIAAALICCALNLLLRKQAPELTLALCAVVCALCFLTVLPFFSPVLAFVRRLEAARRDALPRQRPAGARADD